MEPILCPSCGETVSDKYELFRKKYYGLTESSVATLAAAATSVVMSKAALTVTNEIFEKICKELNIEKMCTKIIFLTTLQIDEAINIQNIKKVY